MSGEGGGGGAGKRAPKRLTVSLGSLYLDPNNFRFVDLADYRKVPPERMFHEDVRRRTTQLVQGKNQEGIQELIKSLTANGWLDVDPILVRPASKGKYVVVEGNRRITALKHLERRYQDAAVDLGLLSPEVFGKVPVSLYEDQDPKQHLILMGLHHISGKKRWPAINRARAMKALLDQFAGNEDAVCESLNISKREFNLQIRTLALTEQYRKSDYGDQFLSEQFNLFREVLKSPAIRDWLGWNPMTCAAAHTGNLERLFSWMSREPDDDESDDDNLDTDTTWTSEPVVTTGGHVRELAKLVGDPDAILLLDQTRSLQQASHRATF